MKNLTFSAKLILLFIVSINHTVFYPYTLTVVNTTNKPFNVIGKHIAGNATDWFTVPAYGQTSRSTSAWCLTEVNTDVMQPQPYPGKFEYHWAPGSCSSVNVVVEKDAAGFYKMTVRDWTDDVSDFFTGSVAPWLQKNLEPIISGGFSFSMIVPNATAAATNGSKIGDAISNNQKTGISDQIDKLSDTANGFLNKINVVGNEATDFINKTGSTLNNLQKTLPGVIKGDFFATLEFMGQLDKLKLDNATKILAKIKTTYDDIVKQVNEMSLKPLIQSAITLCSSIKDLMGNIRLIINGMPSGVINQNLIAPLQNAENDIATLIKQLTALMNEKVPSVNEIATKVINGVVANLAGVGNLVGKVQKGVTQIIADVNRLKDVIIPKFKSQVGLISKFGDNIKDNLLSELKKGENIALMIPPALAALPGTVLSVVSLGLWSPALAASAPVILAAAQPVIKNVLKSLLNQVQFSDMINSVNDLIITVKDMVDQITMITKTFNDANINIFPASVLDIVSTANNIVKDASDIKTQAAKIVP